MFVLRFVFLSFCFLLANPLGAVALEIVSISPSIVASGSRVSVTGGPFEDGLRVLIGDRVVRPVQVTEGVLIFDVPPLTAGDYLLSLQSDDQGTVHPFLLKVVDPKPVILSIDPMRVDLCSGGEERRITVNGQNFVVGAGLLVDGAQLPADQVSSSRIDFVLPALDAGLHRIEIVNPDGNRSLPFAVLIDGVPEIFSVVPGNDRVVSYDLVISGRNFSSSSELLVNGVPVNSSLSVEGKRRGGREVVSFVDCQTLVYTRYPVSREPVPLLLTIIVPGAERSVPFHITAP